VPSVLDNPKQVVPTATKWDHGDVGFASWICGAKHQMWTTFKHSIIEAAGLWILTLSRADCDDDDANGLCMQNKGRWAMIEGGSEVILEAVQKSDGNVLVFLPGAGDIRAMALHLEVLILCTPNLRAVRPDSGYSV
jgi:hypothetical protein